jgi:hypothetical protein
MMGQLRRRMMDSLRRRIHRFVPMTAHTARHGQRRGLSATIGLVGTSFAGTGSLCRLEAALQRPLQTVGMCRTGQCRELGVCDGVVFRRRSLIRRLIEPCLSAFHLDVLL